MPTYDDLRSYFDESQQLQEIAKNASYIPIVGGFTLGVSPLWALAYDMEEGLSSLTRDGWHRLANYYEHGIHYDLNYGASDVDFEIWVAGGLYLGFHRRDLNRKVKLWDGFRSELSSKSMSPLPVTLTIIHYPLRGPRVAADDSDVNATHLLQKLIDIVRDGRGAVRLDERSPARMVLQSGEKIFSDAGAMGTLGGVLMDVRNDVAYGVTCAHVARSGDLITDRKKNLIGRCVADTGAVILRKSLSCDPVGLRMPSPAPGNGPDLNMLDCALVKLERSSPVRQCAVWGISSQLTQGQGVELHGGSTGVTPHSLGSLCLSYQFSDGVGSYCFRDVIELRPRPRGPLGGPIARLMATVPRPGDSGGWVLTNSQSRDWAGMCFATDGTRGFAIRASWVHQWAELAVQATLRV